ncbi:hypothetical protein Zm00014a_018368 [Zea mays]|uniref:Uncharacterized protein n=1 Tax=Zea mays TaxID=4577 RepID=A0A3L6D6S8_MAIZE|nr:hypothetical protein Zm00014a_018368 [Zea mays]
MDDELYDITGCDSHVAASLRCPSQSGAMAVWSSKKSYDICTSAGGPVTMPAHDTYHLAGARLSDTGGLHYPLAAYSGTNASAAAAARELSLTLRSNSIASSNSTLNTTEHAPRERAGPPDRAAAGADLLNDVVGHMLDGVVDVTDDSCSGVGSVSAPSAVSSNRFMASTEDAGALRLGPESLEQPPQDTSVGDHYEGY